MDASRIVEFAYTLNDYVILIATPILILIIGLVLGKMIQRLINLILYQINVRDLFSKGDVLERGAGSLVAYIIYIGTLAIVLYMIGILKEVLIGAAVIMAVLLLVSLVFFLKDLIPNINSYYKHKYTPGKSASIQGIQGKIVKQNLIETLLTTDEGELISVKNKFL